jgi:tryptophanyl-tRNA synthetase
MSLRDGKVKMSKSDPSANSRIHLIDTNEEIKKKIKSAVTDAIDGVSYDLENRPHLANLLDIYSLCSGETVDSLSAKYANAQKAQFKSDLSDVIINKVQPIREEYERLSNDRTYVLSVLKQGASEARERANTSMVEIRKALGMAPML